VAIVEYLTSSTPTKAVSGDGGNAPDQRMVQR
jgi:hypothetical protein